MLHPNALSALYADPTARPIVYAFAWSRIAEATRRELAHAPGPRRARLLVESAAADAYADRFVGTAFAFV